MLFLICLTPSIRKEERVPALDCNACLCILLPPTVFHCTHPFAWKPRGGMIFNATQVYAGDVFLPNFFSNIAFLLFLGYWLFLIKNEWVQTHDKLLTSIFLDRYSVFLLPTFPSVAKLTINTSTYQPINKSTYQPQLASNLLNQ